MPVFDARAVYQLLSDSGSGSTGSGEIRPVQGSGPRGDVRCEMRDDVRMGGETMAWVAKEALMTFFKATELERKGKREIERFSKGSCQ